MSLEQPLKFHVSEDVKKPQWMDVTFGMMYPEPVTDDEVYWIRVDRKNPKDHAWVCDACEKDDSQSWVSNTVSPAYCINCSANTWRQQMYGGDLDKEKTEGCRSAARLTNLLMHRSLVKLKPSEDFVQFLKETARSVIGNEPEYASRVMKAVSTYGAIRIPASMVKNIFSEGKGKQYCVLKESVIEDGKEVIYFRVSADYREGLELSIEQLRYISHLQVPFVFLMVFMCLRAYTLTSLTPWITSM